MMITVTRTILVRLIAMGLAIFFAAFLPAAIARGQEPDEEMPEAADAAEPAAKPAARAGQPAAPVEFEHPAVRSVLDSNPTTPDELLNAIDILIDLDRAVLARPLVSRLIDAKLDAEALAALVRQFGSPVFLKISRSEPLAPDGKQLADAALTAAMSIDRDPKRIAQRAAKLADANPAVREDAAVELLRARSAAVGPVLRVLADPKQAAGHKLARGLIVQLGSEAVGPLLGTLESSEVPLKLQNISLFEAIGDRSAVPYLLAPALSDASEPRIKSAAQRTLRTLVGKTATVADARVLLARQVRQQLTRSRQPASDRDSPVEIWRWDAKQKQSLSASHPSDKAAALTAARLAADLHQLDPHSAPHTRLYLVALLEGATFESGFDKPLPMADGTPLAIASKQSPAIIEAVLADALAGGYTGAAAAAAQILGDIGSTALLQGGPSPAPLARAANSADRRVQFAAVEAILKLKPAEPFVGASAVAEALGHFARSTGIRKALVAHPRADLGQQIASQLAELGFEADVATNPRQAMTLAASAADYELVLIHLALPRPGAEELVAQLRRETRTRRLPIGLLPVRDDLAAAQRVAERLDSPAAGMRTLAIAGSDLLDAMKPQIERLLASAGRTAVTADERKRQAAAALDSIVALSATSQTLFDVHRQIPAVERALYVPDLTAKAAAALGNLGTAASQRALLDVAGRGALPMRAREAAAAAFRSSVRRHGILLTSGEIIEQYDHYNASADADESTQQLLASILDTLERKDAAPR